MALFKYDCTLCQSFIMLKSVRIVCKQDKHFHEVQQWQVRLEEQQERNNTLVEVNRELRKQLEIATENSDKLLQDVNRLSSNWDKLNEELLEKEKVIKRTLLIFMYSPPIFVCRN